MNMFWLSIWKGERERIVHSWFTSQIAAMAGAWQKSRIAPDSPTYVSGTYLPGPSSAVLLGLWTGSCFGSTAAEAGTSTHRSCWHSRQRFHLLYCTALLTSGVSVMCMLVNLMIPEVSDCFVSLFFVLILHNVLFPRWLILSVAISWVHFGSSTVRFLLGSRSIHLSIAASYRLRQHTHTFFWFLDTVFF